MREPTPTWQGSTQHKDVGGDDVKAWSDVSSSTSASSGARRRARKRRRSASRKARQQQREEASRQREQARRDDIAERRRALIDDAVRNGDTRWLANSLTAEHLRLVFAGGDTLLHLVARQPKGMRALNTVVAAFAAEPDFAAMLFCTNAAGDTPFDVAHGRRSFVVALTLLIEAEAHHARVSRRRTFRSSAGDGLSFTEVDAASSSSGEGGEEGRHDGARQGDYTAQQYEALFRTRISEELAEEERAAEARRARSAGRKRQRQTDDGGDGGGGGGGGAQPAGEGGEGPGTAAWRSASDVLAAENAERYSLFFAADPLPTGLGPGDLPWPALQPDGALPVPLAARHSPTVMRHYAKSLFLAWHPDRVTQKFSALMQSEAALAEAMGRATEISQMAAALLEEA